MVNTLHICHPCEQVFPGITAIVSAAAGSCISGKPAGEWLVRLMEIDPSGFLSLDALKSIAGSEKGPVIVLRPIKTSLLARITEHFAGRTVVAATNYSTSAALEQQIRTSMDAYENGHPLLPMDFVVALLLMRKLDQERMWMGHNDKGCMWASDIPKGRGIPEHLAHRVNDVVNTLFQDDILVTKRSKGKNKYALNPERRLEIYGILRARAFKGRLDERLNIVRETAQARDLDPLDDYLNADQS